MLIGCGRLCLGRADRGRLLQQGYVKSLVWEDGEEGDAEVVGVLRGLCWLGIIARAPVEAFRCLLCRAQTRFSFLGFLIDSFTVFCASRRMLSRCSGGWRCAWLREIRDRAVRHGRTPHSITRCRAQACDIGCTCGVLLLACRLSRAAGIVARPSHLIWSAPRLAAASHA